MIHLHGDFKKFNNFRGEHIIYLKVNYSSVETDTRCKQHKYSNALFIKYGTQSSSKRTTTHAAKSSIHTIKTQRRLKPPTQARVK